MTKVINSGSIGYDRKAPNRMTPASTQKNIIPGSLTHLFTTDVWVRSFVLDCADIFGVPSTSETCVSKKDRLLFAYGLMSITSAMRRLDYVWKPMHNKVDPKDAAWEFCRRFHDKFGEMVVTSPTPGEPSHRGLPPLTVTRLKPSQSLPSGSSS